MGNFQKSMVSALNVFAVKFTPLVILWLWKFDIIEEEEQAV